MKAVLLAVLLACCAPSFAYEFFGPPGHPFKWENTSIKYSIVSSGKKKEKRWLARLVKECLKEWAEASGELSFRRTDRHNFPGITIVFDQTGILYDTNEMTAESNPVLGYAQLFGTTEVGIVDSIISINCLGIVSRGFDMKAVVKHEIGHVLGMAHSASIPKATMYMFYHSDMASLHEDDILGISFLYSDPDDDH
jgi:predicted Zn-dependent protease